MKIRQALISDEFNRYHCIRLHTTLAFYLANQKPILLSSCISWDIKLLTWHQSFDRIWVWQLPNRSFLVRFGGIRPIWSHHGYFASTVSSQNIASLADSNPPEAYLIARQADRYRCKRFAICSLMILQYLEHSLTQWKQAKWNGVMGLLVILFYKWPNEQNAHYLTCKQNLRSVFSTSYKNTAPIVCFVNNSAVIRLFFLIAEKSQLLLRNTRIHFTHNSLLGDQVFHRLARIQ